MLLQRSIVSGRNAMSSGFSMMMNLREARKYKLNYNLLNHDCNHRNGNCKMNDLQVITHWLNQSSSRENYHHTYRNNSSSNNNDQKMNTANQSLNNLNIKWWKWALAAGAFYLTYELMSEVIFPIVERESTLHLSVEQEDEAYHWLMSYFAQHSYTQNCRHLSVLSADNRAISNVLGGLFGVFGALMASQGENAPYEDRPVLYVPAHGERHFFMYKGKLMWLLIQKSEQNGDKNKPIRESLKLTILSRDKKLLTDLVEEARKLFKEHKKDKTVVYSPSLDCYDWEELTRKPKRPLNSLVLQGNILDDIMSDVKSFVEGSSFYYNRGIPYRRGILLQGKSC